MASGILLFRISVIGLALFGVMLLVLILRAPIDRSLWVGVASHVPDSTLLAWALAGALGVFASIYRGRLSNAAKWSAVLVAILIASFPTRWLLVAFLGVGEWLPPFGSDTWTDLVDPVIAELIIGFIIALLGAAFISRPDRK